MNLRSALSSTINPQEVAHLAGKYLTFRLANEEYGIEIVKVQEIIGLLPEAKLPLVPDYVRGVINLRGRIIPTIDLRCKFGMHATADTEKTCTIVVEIENGSGSHSYGVVVDEVAEVMDVKPEQVDTAPDFGTELNSRFIKGMGLVNGGLKILLDIDHVLADSNLEKIRERTQPRMAS